MAFLGIGEASGPNYSAADATQGQTVNNAGTLANYGQTALGQAGTALPLANQTATTAINYLEQNPYTSAVNTSLVNQATAGDTANTQRAQANSDLGLAARGMSDSSIAAGANTGIQQQLLGENNAAQNQIANQEVAGTGQRLTEASQIASGLAGTDFQQGVSPIESANSALGSVTQQQINEANAQYQAQQANQGGIGGVLSGLFGPALTALIPGAGGVIAGALGHGSGGNGGYNPNINIPGTVPGYNTDYSSSGYLNG